jgi:hypothetical protein
MSATAQALHPQHHSVYVAAEPVTFGVKASWATARITNLPAGAKVLRRRFRPKSVGVAFVQAGNEVRKYFLGTDGDRLKLLALVGINAKEAQ